MKRFLCCILIIFSMLDFIQAQTISRSKVTSMEKSDKRSGQEEQDTALFFTTQIPFTLINFSMDGNEWKQKNGLNIGTSFVFMVANLSETVTGDYYVTPLFFLGPYLSYGPGANIDGVGSISMGGIIGISSISVTIGYDLFNRAPTIGVGTKLEVLTLSDKMSTSLINYRK